MSTRSVLLKNAEHGLMVRLFFVRSWRSVRKRHANSLRRRRKTRKRNLVPHTNGKRYRRVLDMGVGTNP